MFGRSTKQTGSDQASAILKEGGKGRPTPTRKEAEAAARLRAKTPMDKKAAREVLSRGRADQRVKMREALRTGDERFLPARDQGPVKRFTRDFVDSRLCVAEMLLPALIVILFLSYTGSTSTRNLGFSLQMVVVILTLIDTAWLLFRLRRAIRAKFPDESTRGVSSYAVTRALQTRFMRLPKAQVGLGGRPKAPRR